MYARVMVTPWGSRALAIGVWLVCVLGLAGGCGASKRGADSDEAGEAGEGGSAAGLGGGGGKAGRGAGSGASGGTSTNGGASTSGGASTNGGTSASGGTSTNGGEGATGGGGEQPTGGTAGSTGGAGLGGTGGNDAGSGGTLGGDDGSGGSLAGTGGSGGTTGSCEWFEAATQAPTVILLVDTSTSMWEEGPPAWNLLHDGLMHPDRGALWRFQHRVRLGFASYKGHQGASEDDPACATMTTVAPALYNLGEIGAVYDSIAYSEELPKWETPTAYAINHTAATLAADSEAPGEKYTLLFTDGNPNTCVVLDPQCGQDLAVKATQDAFASGIGLRVVGLGAIIGNPTGCPSSAHCGEAHLQDLANAGVGAPVLPPPNCDDPTSDLCAYRFEACVTDSVLQAAYTPGASDVGHPGVLTSTGFESLEYVADTVSDILKPLIPCRFELDAAPDPAVVVVTVWTTELVADAADGYELDGKQLTLLGAACDSYRDGMDIAVRGTCDDGS